MKNADMPAMPIERLESATGLTKREAIAKDALAGILATREHNTPQAMATAARRAVAAADALLEALEKKQ